MIWNLDTKRTPDLADKVASIEVYSTLFTEVHITDQGIFVELHPVLPCPITRFAQMNGRAIRQVFPNATLLQFV